MACNGFLQGRGLEWSGVRCWGVSDGGKRAGGRRERIKDRELKEESGQSAFKGKEKEE